MFFIKELGTNWKQRAQQIGKGIVLVGTGVLAYLGISSLFGEVNKQGKSGLKNKNTSYKGEESHLQEYLYENTKPFLKYDIYDLGSEVVSSSFLSMGRKLLSVPKGKGDIVLGKSQKIERQYVITARKGEYAISSDFNEVLSRKNLRAIQEYRAGDEFKINTYPTPDDCFLSNHAITALHNGGVVVVWTSSGQDGDRHGVYGQIYDALGRRIGTEFQVNTYTTGLQWVVTVSRLTNDSFVAVWQEGEGKGSGIYGQRYDVNGNKISSKFQIHTVSNCQHPDVNTLSNNGFVVVWDRYLDGEIGSNIHSQIYSSTGEKIGIEFQVNTCCATFSQSNPSVGSFANENGNFAIVWRSEHQDGDGSDGIYGQLYDASGNKINSEFRVNSYTTGYQAHPAVTNLNDGGFVVVWHGGGIYGQIYDSAGQRIGNEFQVSARDSDRQPSVSGLANGDFVVVWQSGSHDGSGYGIYGQRYDSSGKKVSNEFQVNTYILNDQFTPSVSYLNNAGFIVAWSGFGREGFGIYGRLSTPRIVNNNLDIFRKDAVVFNSKMLSARSMWASDTNLSFTIKENIKHGYFEKITGATPIKVSTFTQQNIAASEIRFTSDDSGITPYYEVKVSDGEIETAYYEANIVFHNATLNKPINQKLAFFVLALASSLTCGACCCVTFLGTVMIVGGNIYFANKKAKKIERFKIMVEDELIDDNLAHDLQQIFPNEWLIPHKDIALIHQIERGGEGVIVKAKWQNIYVVYKSCILDKVNMDQEAKEQFTREVRIMLTSKHPNIIQAFGVCIEPNHIGIVMEFMPLGSLANILHNSKRQIIWTTKLDLSIDIVAGVSYLHTHNIAHRDLKSKNVLVYKKEGSLHAKITDFGISKQQVTEKTATATNRWIGTFQYMPPELFGEEKPIYTQKSDIYSLGIIFWEIATRKKPFADDQNAMTIPMRVAMKELSLEMPKQCPSSYANLIKRCWDLRAEKRPSAKEVIEYLSDENHKQEVVNYDIK